MYNNKLYNTRSSGRFNTPGQFVPAAEQQQNQQQQSFGTPRRQQQQQQQIPHQHQQMQSNLQEITLQNDDVDMSGEHQNMDESKVTVKQEERPAWMKSKLAGVKKISNKERRRRQNETLRRLLTPKNALMVLNEMMPHEQVANQFKVETAQNQYYSKNAHNFCADLTLEGANYKGYGENKLSARNSAAEQAIRDLIIRKMNKVMNATDSSSQNGSEGVDDESLPMIQLASFALHKLFAEWEYDGHKVPQLRPSTASVSEGSLAGEAAEAADRQPAAPKPKKPKGPPKARALPSNAAAMHPCMLLTYMRPCLEYRELAAEGDKPQNMLFTMGVEVDGATYIGKAANKKESRKAAARAACTALFGVQFQDGASATTPLHA